MAHIGLVACVGQKAPEPREAKDLYVSALFQKSRAFIERRADRWFILSAKYGLVRPGQTIPPYEETLNTKSAAGRRAWADAVWNDLRRELRPGDRVTILAGNRYREHLVGRLEKLGCPTAVPMRGLRIGRQLQWLSNNQ